MLRASSEIAVAINASSAEGKPRLAPRERPACRALMMSRSELIRTRVSSAIGPFPFEPLIEELEPLVQPQLGLDVRESHSQLDHGEGHVGLNAHDARLSPAQPQRRCDACQCPRR